MASWVLALLGAALLLPSSDLQTFDGLPLSTFPEFALLGLFVPLVASRGLRRLYARFVRRLGPLVARGGLVAVMLVLGVKLMLLASGSHTGFLACYRTPLAPPPGGECERSFENPFGRFGATRIDRYVDFRPDKWDLSFINSLRFNFYPWVPGLPRRDRLPLAVTWRGVVERAEPWVARVTYVGRATVTFGRDAHELPTHYGPPRTVRIPAPAGRHEVVLVYHFDDGIRTGQPAPSFPYATLRLARERQQGGEAAVEVARPALAWRVVAAAADGLLGIAAVSLAAFYARLLAPTWWLLGLVGGGGAAALHGVRPPPWLPRGWNYLPFLAALVVAAVFQPRPRTLLAGYFAVVSLSVLIARRSVSALGTVLTRSAGDDWLTYESHARTILDTWSLHGGEDVFYNMPLYRYVRFSERLLLGDGDLLVLAAGLTTLYFAAVWMVARVAAGRQATVRGRWGVALAGSLVLMLTASTAIVNFVLLPLSEASTWAALLFGFPLLFAARTPRAWPVGTALAGLAAGIRPNQAPGLAVLVAVFLMTVPRRRWRSALAASTVFLTVAALPLAHNLYYGGRFVLFATAGAHPASLTLRPGQLLALGHDAAVRTQAVAKVRQLLYLEPLPDPALRLAMHGLQAAWLLAVAGTIASWRRVDRLTWLLLLWPATFLGVHFFYTPLYYYPRHLVAGYLAMGLVAAYVAGGRGRQGAPEGAGPAT